MVALRPLSFRLSLCLGLTLIVAASGQPATAQTTRPVTPTPAKEKTKKTEKKETAKEKEAAEPIDLNSASAEELMTLPGIGEVTARKIIDARPHKDVADLAALGVPARRIEEIKPLARVRPIPVAVDLNNDPLIRVETLPGVGPALAKEIIAARPFAGYDDLARVKGFGPAKIDSLKGRVKFGKTEKAESARTKAEKAEKTEKAETKVERAEKAETKVERAEKAETAARTKTESKTARAREAGQPGSKVNLNTASLEELDALPGIGQVYAQAIVAGRPYAKIEDVMKLKGIKEVEFGKIKDMITVDK